MDACGREQHRPFRLQCHSRFRTRRRLPLPGASVIRYLLIGSSCKTLGFTYHIALSLSYCKLCIDGYNSQSLRALTPPSTTSMTPQAQMNSDITPQNRHSNIMHSGRCYMGGHVIGNTKHSVDDAT